MNAPIPGQSYRLETFKVPVPLSEMEGTIYAEVELDGPRPQSCAVFVCEDEECLGSEFRLRYAEGVDYEGASFDCPNCEMPMTFSGWYGSEALRPDREATH